MLDRLIQAITEFAYLFRIFAIVHPYQQAIVLRLGHTSRVLGPGWHWIAPLRIEETLYATVTPRTSNLPAQTLTTSDDVQVSLAAIVTWRVSDVCKHLLQSAEHQEAMLDTAAGLLANHVMSVPWSDLKSNEFARTLRSDVKRKARRWGLHVLDVQITDLARTRTLRLLTSPAGKPVGVE